MLKNSKSQVTFNFNHNQSNLLSVKGQGSPVHIQQKKVQGFDRSAISTGFSEKISRIKNKPKTSYLEDQYVNGLQDEIKFLEMELKLLQEKDMQKHGQIDQLEKFFGDGIPINENILAMKNGYSKYKSSNEKKIQNLANEKVERISLIDQLQKKTKELSAQVHQNQSQIRCLGIQNFDKFSQLLKQETEIKKIYENEDEQLKSVKLENRKIAQKLEKLNRSKLIENIMVLKTENHKETHLNQLKQSILEKDEEQRQLEKQYNQLCQLEEGKEYLIKVEQENLSLKKKAIVIDREADNLKNKIKEREMELEEKLKERMTEIESTFDIKAKIQILKELINRENSISVENIEKNAREKQILSLQKIVDQNKKIAKYTDHYSSVLMKTESELEKLAERKPQVRSEIAAYQADFIRLKKSLESQKRREIEHLSQNVQNEEKCNHLKEMIGPMSDKTKKTNDQISSYLQERQRLLEEIKIKSKQLELIYILKGLNFEETEISKVSSKNIQEELMTFLKNWDQIQKNA